MTAKKVAKKKVLKEAKALTEAEMLKLDLANKEMRIVELEIIAVNHKKKVLDLEFNKDMETKRKTHQDLSTAKAKMIESLSAKYELKEGLKAYDPLTGEIRDE